MQKIKSSLFEKQIDASKIWGGEDTNCYTYSENQGMSNAGFCDIVFTVDNKNSIAGSK
jgi:hypothetical protein